MDTYAVYMLRAGRTYDYEDSRATTRIHTAYKVLEALGAAPTIIHGTQTAYDWATRHERHIEACTLNGTGTPGCTISWPEWVTDEMLSMAFSAACTFHTAQGAYNRRGIL